MISTRRTVLISMAPLLLAACGRHDAQPDAAPAAAPPAAEAAPPTGLTGTPGYARRGVDSAGAAYQRQESAVDSLSRQAAGGTP